jgi:hypothetical protein
MPYVPKADRQPYQQAVNAIAQQIPDDRMARPGHMNYVISLLINKVYGEQMRYADHNEIMGVLTCVQDEFYRRFTAPYEDEKIISDGDLTEL